MLAFAAAARAADAYGIERFAGKGAGLGVASSGEAVAVDSGTGAIKDTIAGAVASSREAVDADSGVAGDKIAGGVASSGEAVDADSSAEEDSTPGPVASSGEGVDMDSAARLGAGDGVSGGAEDMRGRGPLVVGAWIWPSGISETRFVARERRGRERRRRMLRIEGEKGCGRGMLLE